MVINLENLNFKATKNNLQQMTKINLIGITKIFPHPTNEKKKYPLLINANATFDTSKVNMITGISGSGKTTLLRIILGFENIDAGEIILGEKSHFDFKKKDYLKLWNSTGYVSQFPQRTLFFNLNLKENLNLYLNKNPILRREPQAIKKQHISNILSIIQLEKIQNDSLYTLSGGEIQKLAIGCAAIQQSQYLICDEPTSQLDQENSEMIINVLEELCKRTSNLCIITTHNEKLIKQDFTHYHLTEGELVKCQ